VKLSLVVPIFAALVVACSGESGDALEPVGAPPSGPPPSSSTGDPGAKGASGEPPPAADAGVDAPPPPKLLAKPIADLAAEVATRSPGTEAGLAALDLTTGEYAGASDLERHVSASSPKVIWVTAAVAKSGVDAVAPLAEPIFADSDNYKSGDAIDLAGGMNAVNVFYTKAGMVDSAVTHWFGDREATNSPRKMGPDNYFTAKDSVTFLTNLDRTKLLDAAGTKQVETWMTLSPRTGLGGSLGTLLPAAARATMMHKGGWLPPGCCSDDATYNTLNEIGIVQVANGHRYAIAILSRRGDDFYGKQVPWVERASCVVYRAVSGDKALDCND
jgi:beta-lactamase class A